MGVLIAIREFESTEGHNTGFTRSKVKETRDSFSFFLTNKHIQS